MARLTTQISYDEAVKNHQHLRKIISENIKYFRRIGGYSQQDLAYHIYNAQSNIHVIENNLDKSMELFTLVKIAMFFEVDVLDLMTKIEGVNYTIEKKSATA